MNLDNYDIDDLIEAITDKVNKLRSYSAEQTRTVEQQYGEIMDLESRIDYLESECKELRNELANAQI